MKIDFCSVFRCIFYTLKRKGFDLKMGQFKCEKIQIYHCGTSRHLNLGTEQNLMWYDVILAPNLKLLKNVILRFSPFDRTTLISVS